MQFINLENFPQIAPYAELFWQGTLVTVLLALFTVIIGFCLALIRQGIKDCLSVLDGGREHLLTVLHYGFGVKFIIVCIIFRVGVHH